MSGPTPRGTVLVIGGGISGMTAEGKDFKHFAHRGFIGLKQGGDARPR